MLPDMHNRNPARTPVGLELDLVGKPERHREDGAAEAA